MEFRLQLHTTLLDNRITKEAEIARYRDQELFSSIKN